MTQHRPQPKRAKNILALAAMSVALAGCDPDATNIGAALLIAAPAHWLSALLIGGLMHHAAGLRARLSLREWSITSSLLCAMMLAAFGYLSSSDADTLWLALTAATFGLISMVPIISLSWVFTQGLRRHAPLGIFLWPALLISFWLPAMVMLNASLLGFKIEQHHARTFAGAVWVLPAITGIGPMGVFVGALIWARRQRIKHLGPALEQRTHASHVADALS